VSVTSHYKNAKEKIDRDDQNSLTRMSNEAKPLINYYARHGYTRHIIGICNDVLRKRGADPLFVFWKAYATAIEGTKREGPSLLTIVIENGRVTPCTGSYYHRQNAF
jgi:hypothetical protein